VSDIDRLAEHERTAPDDAVDAARGALSNGVLRDASMPKGPMEPHVPDAMFTAIPYNLGGGIWRSRDHYAVKLAWYRGDLRVTRDPLHVRGSWVDRKHLVTRLLELAKHGVGRLVRTPGDTSHAYASSSKKLGD
jgi:hypothetical protein